MNAKIYQSITLFAAGVGALLGSCIAAADAIQTLDRVEVYNSANVLEMQFNNPARAFDFAVLGVTPATNAGFKACQITATQGLYCLDGKQLRSWARPTQAEGVGTLVLQCTDPALGFDGAGADTCTSMTISQPGTIWISGKRAGSSSYGLVRVTKRMGAACAAGESALAVPYCAKLFASTANLTGLSAIDGDVGAAFVGPNEVAGPGILGIAATPGVTIPGQPISAPVRKTLQFFSSAAPGAPITIATGDAQLNLRFDEVLQSATLLQVTEDSAPQSYILATTSRGRIIAVKSDGTGNAFEAFNIVSERANSATFPATMCRTGAQQYGIRTSSKSGGIYLTDRNFCQALALGVAPSQDTPFRLVNVQQQQEDLTFSTTSSYPPLAPTVAPGIVIDLADCAVSCIIVYDDAGTRAASLHGVQLASTQSLMTLFQVKGIPDCRWAPALCAGLPANVRGQVVLDEAGALVPLDDSRLGTIDANQLYLNVTPLLPLEITGLFDGSGTPPNGLPRMLISPQYRGQEQAGFTFEALVGITEPGVKFKEVFEFEFDVLKLAGQQLGCGYDYSEGLKPNRTWDVTTTVSEKFINAGGPGLVQDKTNPNRYVDTILNTGCFNPTRGAGTRWSLYNYNLEVAPNGPDVFGKLLSKLYDDLEEARARLACSAVDGAFPGSAPPMRASTCATLASQWSTGRSLLNQCLASAQSPKAASFAADCQAFRAQLGLYQTTVSPEVRLGPDAANRVGEIKSRVLTLVHVYEDRFLPSVPVGGFAGGLGVGVL
jgi:hypothetical protein